MSDYPTRREPGSLAPVEPLTSKTADGKPYERSASVQTEISRALAMHTADWPRLAPDLQNETLVYLTRWTRDRDRDLQGCLLQVLSKRIHRLGRSRLRKFDKFTAEELILKVEIQVFQLVLERKPSATSEFLEVAFAEDVMKRTLMAIRSHSRTPLGHRGEVLPGATDEDGDQIERPMELAPDNRAGPEAIVLEDEQQAVQAEKLETARKLVKDPLQFEALKLHFGKGMPIRSSDPNEIDLMRYLNVSEGRVRYLLRAGKNAIRKALGGQKDDEK